jgi:hypothetical protein
MKLPVNPRVRGPKIEFQEREENADVMPAVLSRGFNVSSSWHVKVDVTEGKGVFDVFGKGIVPKLSDACSFLREISFRLVPFSSS